MVQSTLESRMTEVKKPSQRRKELDSCIGPYSETDSDSLYFHRYYRCKGLFTSSVVWRVWYYTSQSMKLFGSGFLRQLVLA